VEVTCEKKHDFVTYTKKILTTDVKKEILKVIKALKEELRRIDATEEKI